MSVRRAERYFLVDDCNGDYSLLRVIHDFSRGVPRKNHRAAYRRARRAGVFHGRASRPTTVKYYKNIIIIIVIIFVVVTDSPTRAKM
jgi:hypothetical protein